MGHLRVDALLAVGIGATMGLCAFAVDLALELLNSWKFDSVKTAIARTDSFWPPYLAFLFFNMGFACMSGCLVSYVAPLAAGSGIPEVKAYLNGVRIKGTDFMSLNPKPKPKPLAY